MWSVVLDRWVEKPPEDFLKHLYVWVQMRNIPVNHYTYEALYDFGRFAGEVVELPFDPEKAQTKDYVRVLVKFDVSNPLRRAKRITIPGGDLVTIRYDYERLQKRCYSCQRLTHEQSVCPFGKKSVATEGGGVSESSQSKKTVVVDFMDPGDPLYGLIPASLRGIDEASGKPKIAEELLENMRIYIKSAEGQEKMAREDRVKKSLMDLENDSIGQKTVLRLEPAPIMSKDLDKGKGVVFDFTAKSDRAPEANKLMAAAFLAGSKVLQSGKVLSHPFSQEGSADSSQSVFLQEGSTGYSLSLIETTASGTPLKKNNKRSRPGTYKRKANGKGLAKVSAKPGTKIGEGVITESKRKASDDVEPSQSSARFKKPLVVPNEGPSNI
ncbi:hypothetical protein Bca4012_083078 [Brassica carinata]